MSQYAQKRRLLTLEGRRVPQTASQLTGGLQSNTFFLPGDLSDAQADLVANTANQRIPTIATQPQPTGLVPVSNSNPPLPSTSTNRNATQTSPTPNQSSLPITPATKVTPDKSNPSTPINSTSASTGGTLSSNPLPNSAQKLSVAAEASSISQPNRDLASTPLVNKTLPPNLIEAVCVVAAALALIIGGSLFYWFRRKKNKKRITGSESVFNPMESQNHLNRSGSLSSYKRPINGPIDKKTIRLKKQTDSVVSFGPGFLPEPSRNPMY